MKSSSFGDHLRLWRGRRRLTQQALAHSAEMSTRHLSFLETGRASPSREMVLRLAERLDVPLRERNPMLQSAGFAAMYRANALDAPELAAARRALDVILNSHMPNPALVIDRAYNVVASNPALDFLLAGLAPELLVAPVNAVRISLHPQGLARQIVNFRQWRHHIHERLQRQFALSGDTVVKALLDEIAAYAEPEGSGQLEIAHEHPGVFLPLQLRTDAGVLSFISTVTVLGTPHDIALQELALESFFPADAFTAAQLARLNPST